MAMVGLLLRMQNLHQSTWEHTILYAGTHSKGGNV